MSGLKPNYDPERAPKFMGRLSDMDGNLIAYSFWCPGCAEQTGMGYHAVYGRSEGAQKASWDFDGNFETPTFNPSLLTQYPYRKDGVDIQVRCHLFIRKGQIVYCGDCTHPFAGKTVPMQKGDY